MSDLLLLQLGVLVCGTTVVVASLRLVRRLLELRHEQSRRTPPAELAAQLERIEQAVDVTAVEVERIAEANRFLAKLLAERTAPIAAPGKVPERVITPH
jgi:hypothetical protein